MIKSLFKGCLTIPNLLSVIRIALIPVFAVLFYNDQKVIAVVILALSGLSDLFDGKIARKFNQVSELGKILDPVADKVLQLSAVVCFTLNGFLSWIVVVLLGLKELTLLIGGGIISKKQRNMVYSNAFGKIASFITSLSLCMLFFINGFLAPFKTAVYIFLYLSVILSIVAMVQYGLISVFNVGKPKETKPEKSET